MKFFNLLKSSFLLLGFSWISFSRAEVTLNTKILSCSVASGPCSAIVNPNKQKILLVSAESLPEECSFSNSDYDVWVKGPAHCRGTFKVWVLWDAYIWEPQYRITVQQMPVLDGPQWSGVWVSIGDAAPNSRKIHGVALETMSGECSWHYDEKKLTVMKKGSYTGPCHGVFKVLTGPSY